MYSIREAKKDFLESLSFFILLFLSTTLDSVNSPFLHEKTQRFFFFFFFSSQTEREREREKKREERRREKKRRERVG